jgi:hypothetical protein
MSHRLQGCQRHEAAYILVLFHMNDIDHSAGLLTGLEKIEDVSRDWVYSLKRARKHPVLGQ